MFSISPSFYELGNCSDSYDIFQRVPLGSPPLTEDSHLNENLSPKSMAETKAAAASNSHKEAERRRRKRINGHIATLKAILPNMHKTDKASLLGEAVRRVKELKQATAELTAMDHTAEEVIKAKHSATTLNFTMFPTETDEVKVFPCEGGSGLIKATLCCEDRPEMILDLIQALDTVKAKVMRAEMSTIGGRTKSSLWVELVSSNVGSERDLSLGRLRQVLKMVVEKSTLLASSDQILPGNKRPRFYHF
ncbi:transcription factor bHLH30-like [Primulina eburnea]|uniref:transcription factor bHLH30-like n=1 Tax=Primulina eburnea TaxID=1245227 RepID=UPI003C6C1E63